MQITLYQIDTFTNKLFTGNPAAVCVLDQWLPDNFLQDIAQENNLSETAYIVPCSTGYHIRWFTPLSEVKLCGHATLASAFVVFNMLKTASELVSFQSKSGLLTVKQTDNNWLELDFPAQLVSKCTTPPQIIQALDELPTACFAAEDYIVILADERSIIEAKPKLNLLVDINLRGVSITAPGNEYDFVTRFFAPKHGINEDHVTGSAFTQLIPYWSDRLNKNILTAKQLSTRSGVVKCEYKNTRVAIAGQAVHYMTASIRV